MNLKKMIFFPKESSYLTNLTLAAYKPLNDTFFTAFLSFFLTGVSREKLIIVVF